MPQTLKALWQWFKLPPTWRDSLIIYAFAGTMMLYFSPSTQSALPTIHWDSPLPAFRESERLSCTKLTVFDGDTIGAICSGQYLKIRLHGIDAPEMKQNPYGEHAQSALDSLLPQHFKLHSSGADFYQRTLGTLYHNENNLNLWLVEQGFAVAYADKSTPKIYRQAEMLAKKAKRGVWQEAGLQQDPKAWRRYY
ncbi:MAG: thermonuclease family protein [Cardiobacteriaceae bacterium]|nr:thermonuclease family protein [Cardiobacteriaceae bacterium]